MKVADLKAELSKRGLDTKGLKGDLAARLSEALSREAVEPAATPVAESAPAAPEPEAPKADKMNVDKPAAVPEQAVPAPTPVAAPTPAAAPSSEPIAKVDRMEIDSVPAAPSAPAPPTPAPIPAPTPAPKKAPAAGKGKKFDKKPGDKKPGKHADKNKAAGPGGLTVSDILGDELTKLSLEYWAGPQKKPYSAEIVERVYKTELAGSHFSLSRIMLLELSHYLEGDV